MLARVGGTAQGQSLRRHSPARAQHLALRGGSGIPKSPLSATPTFPRGRPLSSSTTYNGQIPTDPATLVTAVTVLCLLLSLLTNDQRETLGVALQILPFVIPYLLQGRR